MAYCDFMIKYDPKKDSDEDITKKILYSIIIGRLKNRKPAVIFVSGDSGEGKSFSAIRLQELLMEVQDLEIRDYFDDMNVYIPLEYPKKIDALLHDKRLKKANILCVHEARTVVKAKNWHSFLTQSVADVNAMSRSVKRLCFMIVSQFIRDITKDVRYTLNYYMKVSRPKGKKARLYIHVLWKDDRDLEKPKLRKRKLSGYLVYPNGRYQRYVPRYLELSKPSKDIVKMFEKKDRESKSRIIRRKLNKLITQMEEDLGGENKKIKDMVDWYSKDINKIQKIGKRYKNKWKIKKEVRKIHGLTRDDAKTFEKLLNERLKEKGIIEVENEETKAMQ